MASGDTLGIFTPEHNSSPTANPALRKTITAATGVRQTLNFNDTTDETAILSSIMPRNYGGGGVKVVLYYAMAGANTSKSVIWDVAFERIADGDAMGAGGSDFAAVQSVTDVADDDADDIDPAEIPFTNGSQMDSVVAGDPFRLKITRDADNGSDDAVGDAQLLYVEIRET